MLKREKGYKFCFRAVSEYAKKYNISLVLVTSPSIHFINAYFEKFQCLDYLNIYDRVLCLDADVMPTPTARNIFDVYDNPKYLYAFHENLNQGFMNRNMWIDNFHPNFVWPTYRGRLLYLNSGVCLYSRGHEKILPLIKKIPFGPEHLSIDVGEQTGLNYVVFQNKISYRVISHSFNRMDLGEQDPKNKRYQADFIHYAGPCHYGTGIKAEVIHQDFINLYENE